MAVREYSIPALADIPESANLADVITRRATEQPSAVTLRRKALTSEDGSGGQPDDQWRDVTAAAFKDEVFALAKALVAAGIGAGDRVGIMSHTRYEWTLADYAIWAAGAVTVPIYETSSAEQTEWILSDSGATAVFVENETFAGLVQVASVQHVWRFDTGLDGLVASGAEVSDETVAERAKAASASDLATIIYTSGTTGRPKGCEITHRNLLSVARNASLGPLTFAYSYAEPSTLLFLPLAHVFGRFIQVLALEAGVTLGHTADIANVLPDLESFQPLFILAVPRVFEKVYNGAESKALAEGKGAIFRRAADTAVAWSEAMDPAGQVTASVGLRIRHALFDRLVYGRLRAALGGKTICAVSGGAALAPRLGHFFRGVGVPVLEGYGLTETTAPLTVNHYDRAKVGTVGLPLPGISVKIADDGEVLASGQIVFGGYRGNQSATDEVLSDGWFRTGDLGSIDDEGFLSITGRKKEIIVTAGGKNVSPGILEDRLRSHGLISQALVVGDGRPYIGALITLDPEALQAWQKRTGKPESATIEDLRSDKDLLAEIQVAVDDANKAVSRAESIRRFRLLEGDFTVEDGQLSAKLGLRRHILHKEFASDIEALYA
ncbi:MAG: AMP-dependent synthetase/ligase [Streptosporangiaceae bacterium]|jgi:long-chain acyl-CoA synthetase